MKLAYEKNKTYGQSFAFRTKPIQESGPKESVVSDMVVQVNTRKMGVRPGT